MSVRLRKWTDKKRTVRATWIVDVKYRHADGSVQAVRQTSPIQTKRGAQQHERQLRDSLQNGTFGKEVNEVPTLAQFKERFLTYSENNNKPSAVHAKRLALKNHLEPVFGKLRLNQIRQPTCNLAQAAQPGCRVGRARARSTRAPAPRLASRLPILNLRGVGAVSTDSRGSLVADVDDCIEDRPSPW